MMGLHLGERSFFAGTLLSENLATPPADEETPNLNALVYSALSYYEASGLLPSVGFAPNAKS
jgi:hypothetical protein